MTSPVQAQDSAPKARVVGSNYTVFTYAGLTLAYLDTVQDSGTPAYGGSNNTGFEMVHPLGYDHPIEIATGRIMQAGTLTLTLRELWNQEVWQQFPLLTGAATIIDVFEILAQSTTPVTCTKVINAPDGSTRGKIYHNVTIVSIDTSDTIQITALTIPRQMVAAYTHTTKL